MSDNPTSGQTLTRRSESPPAPRITASGLRCSPFIRGFTQPLTRGLAHERALLRRMAGSRFGTETAERLAEALAGIADPERLAEVGEWLVRCETGGEFLARVVAARTEAGRGDV